MASSRLEFPFDVFNLFFLSVSVFCLLCYYFFLIHFIFIKFIIFAGTVYSRLRILALSLPCYTPLFMDGLGYYFEVSHPLLLFVFGYRLGFDGTWK